MNNLGMRSRGIRSQKMRKKDKKNSLTNYVIFAKNQSALSDAQESAVEIFINSVLTILIKVQILSLKAMNWTNLGWIWKLGKLKETLNCSALNAERNIIILSVLFVIN